MKAIESLKTWARRVKRDGVTLWFAYRNPDTPAVVKVLCGLVVAYALSPIDLIPDFIPVLGYLDEVLLLPGLIWLAIKTLPPAVLEASRQQADAWMASKGAKPRSRAGAVLIVAIWIGIAYLAWRWFMR